MTLRRQRPPAPTICVLSPVDELRKIAELLRQGERRGTTELVHAHIEARARIAKLLELPRQTITTVPAATTTVPA